MLGNKLETCSVSAAWAGWQVQSVGFACQCSVGAWSGWQGLQISNILQWPDLLSRPAVGTCADWSLVSELGSALGCFQPQGLQCGLWLICNVATLSGDSFAWQQVGNLQCQCSMGRLASLKCWICLTVQCWSMVMLAGAADLQHLAVARSALLSRPAVETLFDQCSWLLSTPRLAEPCQVTALLGNKLKTCSVSAAWAGWQV